ncbi:MAG: Gfo/Idh/MocA family oxidoreductase [Chloroflexi bacterium]|nr:Gfo/Idh/MocA family oxidoreductase [Chloroflexota bacterium]
MSKPLKLAVVGGRRGASFNHALARLKESVTFTAVCDLSEAMLASWRTEHPDIQTFTSYDDLLEKADCDAVFICTPMLLHAGQSVKALEAGKHVLSEVVAAATLDECWQLVETVERTGRAYMLAENFCYMRPNMMVLNMVQGGVFGDVVYTEGAYIHDCRALSFTPNNELTWRGELRRQFNGNLYPTHSLGPVSQWLGINRRDRLVSTATWTTPAVAAAAYVRERLGPDHPGAANGFWSPGDSATTVIQTERGAVIVLRVDWASPRPHNMTHYVVQGTSGAYLSGRHDKEDPLVWIDGQSPGRSYDGKAQWESLWSYADRYEHPQWRELGADATLSGHGGGDFFVLKAFCDAVQAGATPPIDVYDAVTWSAIVPLSIESVAKDNAPVAVPDFARRRKTR